MLLLREGSQARQVLRAQVDALDGSAAFRESFLGDAGIAQSAPHLRGMGRLRQFPHQGVFASAGADDENSHGCD